MVTTVLVIIGCLAGLYLMFLVVAALVSVRPPRIPVFLTPAQLGCEQETVAFQTEDGIQIEGWWVSGGSDTVVIAAHGYLVNRCEFVPYVPRLQQLGASVLLIDHRCHGGSSRARCTYGTTEAADIQAAIGFARNRVPGCKIVGLGSSMGAVALVQAAATNPADFTGLILDAPYRQLNEAATGFWKIGNFGPLSTLMRPVPLLGRLVLGVDPKQVETPSLLRQIVEVPILLLYGTSDTVVPLDSARECAAAAGPRARIEWFEGCQHGSARLHEADRYFNVIREFLAEHALRAVPQKSQIRSTKAAASTV